MNINQFKQENPQYANVPDTELAFLLHKKFYPDRPIKDFLSQVGVDPTQAQIDAGRDGKLWNYWRGQVEQRQDGETDQELNERLYGTDFRAKPLGTAEGVARSAFQGIMAGGGDEVVPESIGRSMLDPIVVTVDRTTVLS